VRSAVVVLLLLAGALAGVPSSGSAEEEGGEPSWKPPDPVRRARWSEEWSAPPENVLLLSGDEWRPPKHIPLGKSGEAYLSFGGEYRLAYEIYDPADMGLSDVGRQDAVLHRLAAHALFRPNKKWRIFGQLGFADSVNREGGAHSRDETKVDIWQLFIDHGVTVGDEGRVVVRLGRQILETANYYIGAAEARNVRQYYDGLRLVWIDRDIVRLDAFAAEYVDAADGAFDMSGTGEYFWGTRYGMHLWEGKADLSALYLGWDLKDRQFEQGGAGFHYEQRHHLALWLYRPLSGVRQWGLDYYLAYQFGQYDDRPGGSDISAFAAFGELRYAFQPRGHTPVAGLRTSYFSGDKDPTDDELNTFYDPVFVTPYFSYARDVMAFNIVQIQPLVGYRFGSRLLVTLRHEFLWRAETSDAFYNKANGIGVRAEESDSRWIGQQSQVAVNYRPNPHIIVAAFYSRFLAGDVITDAGGGDRDYFYAGINFLL
jgi:hypothetical protein